MLATADQRDDSNGQSITIERLTTLLSNAVLLPIYPQRKKPLYRWRKISFSQSIRPRYRRWLNERANTGVVLGERSGNLCAIDVDNDQLMQEFVNLNPDLAGTLCSKGARGCQFWLQMDGAYPHCVHKLKTKSGEKWGEWRADGGQSIIRGIHPDGMHYRLLCDAPPIRIRFDQIRWPSDLILPWKNLSVPVAEKPASGCVPPLIGDISERVRRYLEKVPASIGGNGGDDQLFHAAGILVNGFGLDPEQALPFLREYNARAEPPWPEYRLVYKLTEALENPRPGKPRGYLLNATKTAGNGPLPPPSFAEKLNFNDTDHEDSDEKIFEELLAKYQAALCTSQELESLNIPPRKFLMGKWMREGDLGFVFGERGSGKTWLVDAIATHLSTGRDLFGWNVPEAAEVMYVDGEMPLDAARDRLKGMSQANQRLHILHHERLFDQFGLAMNLTNERTQRVITALCIKKSIKLLILDNLSCLFSGMKENDADEWEKVLNWLLDLRRRRIAVLIVHHAGTSGRMRGTTRREDAAFWVIRVDEKKDREQHEKGARFETIFEKQRNSDQREWTREWTFQTEANGEVLIGSTEISFDGKVLQLIQDGIRSATDLAEELRVSKSTICKAAGRLEQKNLIERKGGNRYTTYGATRRYGPVNSRKPRSTFWKPRMRLSREI